MREITDGYSPGEGGVSRQVGQGYLVLLYIPLLEIAAGRRHSITSEFAMIPGNLGVTTCTI